MLNPAQSASLSKISEGHFSMEKLRNCFSFERMSRLIQSDFIHKHLTFQQECLPTKISAKLTLTAS